MSAMAKTPQRPGSRSLLDEIHRRVGRNLLMFQAAEESLRFVLPYIHPDGSKKVQTRCTNTPNAVFPTSPSGYS